MGFEGAVAAIASKGQYDAQLTNFLKNIAIMGGMLMVWAFGPGSIAVARTTAWIDRRESSRFAVE